MIITDSVEYRIGDFVVVDGAGPAFTTLSGTLGMFDEDWKNLERKPWHTAWISRKVLVNDNGVIKWEGDWWVSEAKGGVGITETRLSLFKEPYLVFRWFDNELDEDKVRDFINQYRGEKYDSFWGYLFVILWYCWRRWPFVIDYNWTCWEWLWFFASSFGKAISSSIHEYPFLPLLLGKIEYPGWPVENEDKAEA